jgi:hypothetical protein
LLDPMSGVVLEFGNIAWCEEKADKVDDALG